MEKQVQKNKRKNLNFQLLNKSLFLDCYSFRWMVIGDEITLAFIFPRMQFKIL